MSSEPRGWVAYSVPHRCPIAALTDIRAVAVFCTLLSLILLLVSMGCSCFPGRELQSVPSLKRNLKARALPSDFRTSAGSMETLGIPIVSAAAVAGARSVAAHVPAGAGQGAPAVVVHMARALRGPQSRRNFAQNMREFLCKIDFRRKSILARSSIVF